MWTAGWITKFCTFSSTTTILTLALSVLRVESCPGVHTVSVLVHKRCNLHGVNAIGKGRKMEGKVLGMERLR